MHHTQAKIPRCSCLVCVAAGLTLHLLSIKANYSKHVSDNIPHAFFSICAQLQDYRNEMQGASYSMVDSGLSRFAERKK